MIKITYFDKKRISIPYGAIKSIFENALINDKIKFQFLMVRLKAFQQIF